MSGDKTREQFRPEIADLRAQLEEAQETLRAIRQGEVDAIVVETSDGNRIYTLQGAEHDYRLLVEQMHEGAATLDPAGRITYANQCLADMLHRPLEQVIGSRLEEHVVAQYHSRLASLLRLSQKNPARGEVVLHAADGMQVPAQFTLSPQLNGASGRYLVAMDRKQVAVERAHAEAALRESEQKYRELFESIDQGFCIIEVLFDEHNNPVDYRFLMVNPAFEKQTGIPDAEGRRMREIAPLHEEHWFQTYGRTALTGEPQRFVNVAKQLHRYYDVYAWRVGEPAQRRVAILFNDITALKRAEEEREQLLKAVEEQRARLQAVLDVLPVSVWVADAGGKMTLVNQAAATIFGGQAPTVGKIEGYGVYRIWQPKTGQRVRVEDYPLVRALRGQTVHEAELDHERFDGSRGTHLASAVPIRDSQGTLLGAVVTAMDITERKLAEERLRISEEKFAKAFAGNPAAVALTRLEDGLFLDVNDTWEKLNGYRRDEIIGQSARKLPIWPTAAAAKRFVQELQEKGSLHGWEQEFLNRSGQTFVAMLSAQILTIQGQEAILSTLVDITDRKQAEQALRDSEQRLAFAHRQLQDIIDGTPNTIVFVKDTQGRFITINHRLEQLLGMTREQLRGKTDYDIFPKDRADYYRTHDQQVLSEGKPVQFEELAVLADGQEHAFLASKFPLFDADGKPYAVCSISADITARKQAEEMLRQLNERLEQRVAERTAELEKTGQKVQAERQRFLDVLETLPVIVTLLRPDYRVVWANRAYREALGDNVGRLCYASQFGRDKPCEECQAFHPLQTGQPHNWEWALPNGRTFDIHNFPFADIDGSPLILEMDMDITARKQAEAALAERSTEVQHRAEQLQAMAAQLAEAEQKERQRLALLLHDGLQQLLVGTKFHVGVLRSELKAAKHREMLKQVDDLLDESLDASRSLTVDLSPPILQHGTMAQVLQWLAQWFAAKHGLLVKVHADEKAHPQAPEVRALLFQVVRELLFNAVKHAEVDRACVELSRTPDSHVKVIVTDAGKGFDPSLPHGSRSQGSGFGLLSIRERLDWLGGKFEIDSSPGRGTHATIVAPMRLKTAPDVVPAAPEVTAPAAGAPSGGNGKAAGKVRVVLADDHAVMRDGLSAVLQRQPDIDVVGQAADGRQAVDVALQLQPDVIIMDVNMPEMDGKEATRQILAHLPHIKVIGLSMFAESDVAEAMKAAGAAAYLAKTSGPDALVAAIRKSVRKQSESN